MGSQHSTALPIFHYVGITDPTHTSGPGILPNPSSLPASIPIFSTAPSGLALLAVVATQSITSPSALPSARANITQGASGQQQTLPNSSPSGLNEQVAVPPKLVKRILELEFIEMNELLPEAWGVDVAHTLFGKSKAVPAGIRL